MKLACALSLLFLVSHSLFAQNIGDFQSIEPRSQDSQFIIPSSHRFQKIIEEGDELIGGGVLPGNTDFTGFVPIGGSNENGYLSINSELTPGGVSILDISFDSTTKLWNITQLQKVDFGDVVVQQETAQVQ